MNENDAAAAPANPAPATPAPRSATESGLEQVARELLRDRRNEARWRLFFRLAWLALAVALVWGLTSQHLRNTAATRPHTALVEVRGEISAEG